MEKRCSGKETHPPSRVNLSKRLYEKKNNPFARANSACACSDCLGFTKFAWQWGRLYKDVFLLLFLLLFIYLFIYLFIFFNDARPTDFEEKIEGLLTG